jgi:hypothetical protein
VDTHGRGHRRSHSPFSAAHFPCLLSHCHAPPTHHPLRRRSRPRRPLRWRSSRVRSRPTRATTISYLETGFYIPLRCQVLSNRCVLTITPVLVCLCPVGLLNYCFVYWPMPATCAFYTVVLLSSRGARHCAHYQTLACLYPLVPNATAQSHSPRYLSRYPHLVSRTSS